MSLQELRANFEEFLSELIKGEEDPEKIRVILGRSHRCLGTKSILIIVQIQTFSM